jgi:hypothetical protein
MSKGIGRVHYYWKHLSLTVWKDNPGLNSGKTGGQGLKNHDEPNWDDFEMQACPPAEGSA